MNKWKDLDPSDLPADILVDGAWEIQWHRSDGIWLDCTSLSVNGGEYRIRRPEGGEPDRCPTCGSTQRNKFYPPECSYSNRQYDPWHDKPKPPTHEEIKATLTAADFTYRDSLCRRLTFDIPIDANINPVRLGDVWKLSRESADIQPEGV